MSDTLETRPPARRRIGIAVLLSLCAAGVGQIYAGRGRRGAVLFAIALAHVPFLVLLSRLPPSDFVLYAMAGTVVFGGLFFVFVLVDAALVASKAERPYRRRVYNNAWLYLGLVVLATVWEIGGMAWTRAHAFEAFVIPTASMSPTIGRHDRILVNKSRADDLRRGDMIVFRAPGERGRKHVKRVIGLPGETVGVREGVVHVGARPLVRRPTGEDEIFEETWDGRGWRVRWRGDESHDDVTVPAGHVFVLGDHRSNSQDSRRYGSVPLGDVVGVVEYVFWPGPEGGFGVVR